MTNPMLQLRRSRFTELTNAVALIGDGELEFGDIQLNSMRASLRDIPIRDAFIAHVTRDPESWLCAKVLMDMLAEDGDVVPARTIRAAILYMSNQLDAAKAEADAVLDSENYSLAKLLVNGIAWDAPPTLLQGSLGHFDPDALLDGSAE